MINIWSGLLSTKYLLFDNKTKVFKTLKMDGNAMSMVMKPKPPDDEKTAEGDKQMKIIKEKLLFIEKKMIETGKTDCGQNSKTMQELVKSKNDLIAKLEHYQVRWKNPSASNLSNPQESTDSSFSGKSWKLKSQKVSVIISFSRVFDDIQSIGAPRRFQEAGARLESNSENCPGTQVGAQLGALML